LFLHDHRWFTARSFEQATIDRQLASAGRAWRTAWERHLSELFIAGIITEYEYSLLLESHEIAKKAPQVADLRARFHELMGVDSPLSHVDQLRVAIAIIVSASESFAKILVKEFSPPLKRKDTRTVTRISAVYLLLDLLEKMRARLTIRGSAASQGTRPLRMDISVGGVYAEELLARAISALRDEFKTDIDYSVVKEKGLLAMDPSDMISR